MDSWDLDDTSKLFLLWIQVSKSWKLMSSSASSTNLQKTVIGNVIGNSTELNLYPKTRADFSEVFAGTQCSAVLRQRFTRRWPVLSSAWHHFQWLCCRLGSAAERTAELYQHSPVWLIQAEKGGKSTATQGRKRYYWPLHFVQRWP